MGIPVKYIGKKPQKTDSICMTNYIWQKGATLLVPDDIALRLFQYPDVWAEGSIDDVGSIPKTFTEDGYEASKSEVDKAELKEDAAESSSVFDQERIAQLQDAIEMLDPTKKGDFDGSSGMPDKDVLEDFVGFKPSATEIKEAFTRFTNTSVGEESEANPHD